MNNIIRCEMENHIVEMVFATKEVLQEWLNKVLEPNGGSCEVTYYNEVIITNNLNQIIGFMFDSDPNTKAVMIASALAGCEYWMFSFPNLLKKVNKRWRES